MLSVYIQHLNVDSMQTVSLSLLLSLVCWFLPLSLVFAIVVRLWYCYLSLELSLVRGTVVNLCYDGRLRKQDSSIVSIPVDRPRQGPAFSCSRRPGRPSWTEVNDLLCDCLMLCHFGNISFRREKKTLALFILSPLSSNVLPFSGKIPK